MNRPDPVRPARALRRSIAVLAFAMAWCAALPTMAQMRSDAPLASSSQVDLPTWDRLTPAQRAQLIGPLRERWNADPTQRARLLDHARRWQQLTPEQRQRAQRGRDRLHGMTPAQRAEARAAFQRMRALPDAERKALREKLRTMTPEQRREWLRTEQGPRAAMP